MRKTKSKLDLDKLQSQFNKILKEKLVDENKMTDKTEIIRDIISLVTEKNDSMGVISYRNLANMIRARISQFSEIKDKEIEELKKENELLVYYIEIKHEKDKEKNQKLKERVKELEECLFNDEDELYDALSEVTRKKLFPNGKRQFKLG